MDYSDTNLNKSLIKVWPPAGGHYGVNKIMEEEIILKRFDSNQEAIDAQDMLKRLGIPSKIKFESGDKIKDALGASYGRADLRVSAKDFLRANEIINR